MSHPGFVSRATWLTVRDIVGGLVVGVGLGALVDATASPLPLLLRRAASALTAISLLTLAGRAWGRDLALLAGALNTRAATRAGGFAVGPGVVLVGGVLAALEPSLVARGASVGVPIHLIYRLLFIPAAFVVAATGAFALGCGLRNARLGVSLAAWAGLGAATAFLVINLLLDALGWRVGAPHAAERATMLAHRQKAPATSHRTNGRKPCHPGVTPAG